MKNLDAVIVGGAPVGTAMAIDLSFKGITSVVIEQGNGLSPTAAAGTSIANDRALSPMGDDPLHDTAGLRTRPRRSLCRRR